MLWLEDAENDLLAFKAYMNVRNPESSSSILQAVFHSVDLLSDNPLMGKVDDIHGTRIFSVPDSPLKIIYTAEKDCVYILFIPHQKQQWPPQ